MNEDRVESEEVDIIEYLKVVYKYKVMIVVGTIVAAMIAGAVSIRKPDLYESTASFLPSTGSEVIVGTQTGFAVSVEDRGKDILLVLLESRRIAEKIIRRLDLMKVWDGEDLEETIDALKGSSKISEQRGLVRITVIDKDAQLAAQIANTYMECLGEMKDEISISRVKQSLLFIEKRLEETKKILTQAELSLRDFEAEHKMVSLDEQIKAAVTDASKLQTEIIMAEVKLKEMQSYLTENDPELALQQVKLTELKKQLGDIGWIELTVSSNNKEITSTEEEHSSKSDISKPYPALREFPELSLRLGQLKREVEVQQGVYRLLMQQYEAAKIEAAKEEPGIQIIDKAVPAQRPISKGVKSTALVAGSLSLMVLVFLSFFIEYIHKYKEKREENDKQRTVT